MSFALNYKGGKVESFVAHNVRIKSIDPLPNDCTCLDFRGDAGTLIRLFMSDSAVSELLAAIANSLTPKEGDKPL